MIVNFCHGQHPVHNSCTNKLIACTNIDSPVKYFVEILAPVFKHYNPAHSLYHPAYSILAEFSSHIIFPCHNTIHPKKDPNLEAFKTYITHTNAEVKTLQSLLNTTTVFTDNSFPADPVAYSTYTRYIIHSEVTFPMSF